MVAVERTANGAGARLFVKSFGDTLCKLAVSSRLPVRHEAKLVENHSGKFAYMKF